METITLTKEQLEELIQQRVKQVKKTDKSIFKDVSFDGMKDIAPINRLFPTVIEKLENNGSAVNPERLIYNCELKKTPSGLVNGYWDATDTDVHENIRKLVLNVFGKYKNKELLEDEYEWAAIYYQDFVNLFKEKYHHRLLTLEDEGLI